MFDDDLDSQVAPATMFPFLSVLFCTIGALVVIMVIGSMLATVKGEGVDEKIITAKSQAAGLASLMKYVDEMEQSISQMAQARTAWSTLNDAANSMTGDFESENRGLADLVAKGSDDMTYVEKASLALLRNTKLAAHETIFTKWQASKTEVDTARKEKSELTKHINAAKKEIDDLQKEADRPVVRFLFGEDPQGRKPVLVELKADGVLVRSGGAPRPEGTTVPKVEASAKSGFLDRLAASLTRPGAGSYAVLFVRPGAEDLFFAATDRLRRRRAPYASEPVESNWKLVFDTDGSPPN
jgi:hypothetical protein